MTKNAVYAEQSTTSWFALLPYLVAAFGLALSEVLQMHLGTPAFRIDRYHDDAYYYFTIARHLTSGEGSTFDGLSATNGYHPLWMLILTPVFFLDKDPLRVLVWIKLVSAVFWIASVFIVLALVKRLGALIEGSLLLLFLLPHKGLWLGGMETTVALTLVLWIMYRILSDNLLTTTREAKLLPTGILLALAIMARLDLVFFAGCFCVFYFLACKDPSLTRRLRRTFILGIPSTVSIAAYMTYNQIVYGTALPVSGEAKALDGPFWNPQAFTAYFTSRPVGWPVVDVVPTLLWWLLLFLPALAALRLRLVWRDEESARSALTLELMAWSLVAGNMLQLIYYAFTSSWPLWTWYFYFIPLLFIVCTPIWLNAFISLARVPRKVLQPLPALVTLAVAGRIIVWFSSVNLAPPATYDFKTQAIAVADFLEKVLDKGAVVAMGDRAGSVGYLLDRKLIQTEGLVNSKAYLDALASGRANSFIQNKGVTSIVYSGKYPPPAPGAGAGFVQICEPKFGRGPKFCFIAGEEDLLYKQPLDGTKDEFTTIWRYRSELNRDDLSLPSRW